MADSHHGGCICGKVRFSVIGDPRRITICHCKFCQRLTGGAFLVEPIFAREQVKGTGEASVYTHRSDESGKRVSIHFCPNCGTSLFLGFERFPDIFGICGGTFDDAIWIHRSSAATRHLFTRSAQDGVVLPAGVETYPAHAMQLDGSSNPPVLFDEPVVLGDRASLRR